jgi:hypothetical protein
MCVLRLPSERSARAVTTLPRHSSDLLMLSASRKRSGVSALPDLSMRSLPAKSTRFSCKTKNEACTLGGLVGLERRQHLDLLQQVVQVPQLAALKLQIQQHHLSARLAQVALHQHLLLLAVHGYVCCTPAAASSFQHTATFLQKCRNAHQRERDTGRATASTSRLGPTAGLNATQAAAELQDLHFYAQYQVAAAAAGIRACLAH